ncbi:hypothetical protein [Streptomyces sp. NBC_01320]|uniref:hypothetical protein n=1 Tax=Streptomyces sp. NBC_01320 TaxID=2903824 RepID=UPI002E0F7C74|nr:hypothetical protein OG395_16255 [Streptomyces sp. NBC_01320]
MVVVGCFSAKRKDFTPLVDAAAAELTARGARVVAQSVRRRGFSAGGAKKMRLPYCSRTLMSYGQVRDVAATREETRPDAVVFLTPLTERQRRVLAGTFARPAISLTDVRGRSDDPGRIR